MFKVERSKQIFQHLQCFGFRVSIVKLVPQNSLSPFHQEASCHFYSCHHLENFTISVSFAK